MTDNTSVSLAITTVTQILQTLAIEPDHKDGIVIDASTTDMCPTLITLNSGSWQFVIDGQNRSFEVQHTTFAPSSTRYELNSFGVAPESLQSLCSLFELIEGKPATGSAPRVIVAQVLNRCMYVAASAMTLNLLDAYSLTTDRGSFDRLRKNRNRRRQG